MDVYSAFQLVYPHDHYHREHPVWIEETLVFLAQWQIRLINCDARLAFDIILLVACPRGIPRSLLSWSALRCDSCESRLRTAEAVKLSASLDLRTKVSS